ncbi:hypothetical protein [Bacteroides sedimenti]|uniref:Lipoprotein n=1 Tax=Bacteroides sedimenti TaxID=2136147 RepID=A0ABN6YZK9_9BACE
MKKLILLFLTLFIFGCSEEKDKIEWSQNSILLLKVDYTTNKFEGGNVQQMNGDISSSDTIPIAVNYKAPGDFGNISLYYLPTNTLIFDGSIIWMGTGVIKHPKEFVPADKFALLSNPIDKPDDFMFKCIFGPSPTDYSLIWNSISKLRIVAEYLKSNKRISLFLYTPSVGIGNPKEWDWIVIMD